MKKLFMMAVSAMIALSSFAVNADKEKVAKAPQKTIDGMLNTALQLNAVPGAAAEYDNGKLIQYAFSQVGYDLSANITTLATEGTAVKKQAKLAVGDLIFFNDGQAGIVYKIGEDNSISFLHVVNGQVMISSSTGLGYKCGTHITSDKEISALRKEYEKEQKAIAKAKEAQEKAQADAEKAKAKAQEAQEKAQADAAKAAAKAEKAKQDAEKEAQKAQEKIDKANKDAEKAAAKAEKAEQKYNDVAK